MSRSPSRSDRASEASADSLDTPPQPPHADSGAVVDSDKPHAQPRHDTGDAQNEKATASAAGNEEHEANGNEASESANATGAEASNVTALFIGLGPAARSITEDEIRALLTEKASDPALIGDVRLRGRCAFADIKSSEEATRLIAALDGEMYQDKCRLAVQVSRHPRREGSNERRERRPRSRAVPSLFVGLGPAGDNISDEEVRRKLEEACPLTAFRRRGQCVFIEVASLDDAEKMIASMNNQYIGAARLSVQYSRDSNSRGEGGRRGGRGGPMGAVPPFYAPPSGAVGGYYGAAPSGPRGRLEAMGGGAGRRNERLRERSRSRGRDERRRSRRAHRSDSRDRRRRRRSRSLRSVSPRSASYSRSRSRSRPRRVSPPSSRASSDSRDRRSRRHYPARRV